VTNASHEVIKPLPVVLKVQPDELLSSWLARHATYYGVARRRLLDHVGLSAPSLEALDHEVSLAQQIVLAGFFHCEPAEVAAMSHVAVREDLRRLVRRSVALQECRNCARIAELANAPGAIARSWMQGWRITCRACGGRLVDASGSQETETRVDVLDEYWCSAREGEELLERQAFGFDATALSPIAILRLLLLPRWPEPNEIWDAYRQTWLLNVLVPGFDETVHRFGAKAAMSRKPFLPIALRIQLLAGVAIAMHDPVQAISCLRAHTRSSANQRFTEIEVGLRTRSAIQSHIGS
jgi:hypothetical protein